MVAIAVSIDRIFRSRASSTSRGDAYSFTSSSSWRLRAAPASSASFCSSSFRSRSACSAGVNSRATVRITVPSSVMTEYPLCTRFGGIVFEMTGMPSSFSYLYNSTGLACASATPIPKQASSNVRNAFTRRSNPVDRREFGRENRHSPLDCQGTRSHPRASQSKKPAHRATCAICITAVRPGATTSWRSSATRTPSSSPLRLPHQIGRFGDRGTGRHDVVDDQHAPAHRMTDQRAAFAVRFRFLAVVRDPDRPAVIALQRQRGGDRNRNTFIGRSEDDVRRSRRDDTMACA